MGSVCMLNLKTGNNLPDTETNKLAQFLSGHGAQFESKEETAAASHEKCDICSVSQRSLNAK